jgi:hypothetical protein
MQAAEKELETVEQLIASLTEPSLTSRMCAAQCIGKRALMIASEQPERAMVMSRTVCDELRSIEPLSDALASALMTYASLLRQCGLDKDSVEVYQERFNIVLAVNGGRPNADAVDALMDVANAQYRYVSIDEMKAAYTAALAMQHELSEHKQRCESRHRLLEQFATACSNRHLYDDALRLYAQSLSAMRRQATIDDDDVKRVAICTRNVVQQQLKLKAETQQSTTPDSASLGQQSPSALQSMLAGVNRQNRRSAGAQ